MQQKITHFVRLPSYVPADCLDSDSDDDTYEPPDKELDAPMQ